MITHKRDRSAELKFFATLPLLEPPTDVKVRALLEQKLAVYKKRIKTEADPNIDLVFERNKNFRDSAYKIILVEMLLNATEKINILDVVKKQIQRYGDLFEDHEFYSAYSVITLYLEVFALE